MVKIVVCSESRGKRPEIAYEGKDAALVYVDFLTRVEHAARKQLMHTTYWVCWSKAFIVQSVRVEALNMSRNLNDDFGCKPQSKHHPSISRTAANRSTSTRMRCEAH